MFLYVVPNDIRGKVKKQYTKVIHDVKRGGIMRFLMVDKICELERGKRARGVKNISWDDYFLEEIFPDIPVFSSVVATECIAQLLSWMIQEARNFTVKPVITIVDSYHCTGHIMPGDQLEIEGELESFSEESVLGHGKALVNGVPVIEIEHGVGFLYPLAELDPPERARRQFENIFVEGFHINRTATRSPDQFVREKSSVAPKKWFDRIVDNQSAGSIMCIKNVTGTADYLNDHFPLKPVLPGVLILEALISTARTLVKRLLDEKGLGNKEPVLSGAQKIKFRSFIVPGDQLVMEGKLLEFCDDKSRVIVKGLLGGKMAASIKLDLLHCDEQLYWQTFFPDNQLHDELPYTSKKVSRVSGIT